MPEKIGKAQRWLELVVFLLRHRLPVTVEQIMENVPGYAGDWATEDETRRDSVRRKFERDTDALRALGICELLDDVDPALEGRRLFASVWYPQLARKAGGAVVSIHRHEATAGTMSSFCWEEWPPEGWEVLGRIGRDLEAPVVAFLQSEEIWRPDRRIGE
jgi:hypothetical protein